MTCTKVPHAHLGVWVASRNKGKERVCLFQPTKNRKGRRDVGKRACVGMSETSANKVEKREREKRRVSEKRVFGIIWN